MKSCLDCINCEDTDYDSETEGFYCVSTGEVHPNSVATQVAKNCEDYQEAEEGLIIE